MMATSRTLATPRGVSRAVFFFGLSCLVSCRFKTLDRCTEALPGDSLECVTPGELDRAFDLEVPENWDGTAPLPLIYAFHGGGGHRSSAESVTCPGGELGHPDCLAKKALARGYAIVRPDGTGGRPLRNVRTWNAGGGVGDWACVSGAACNSEIDDMVYLDKVHDEVIAALSIDTSRVYATGISNGAAISHRLACERSDRIAAIAGVGGANQFAASGGACEPGVAILQIHGTDDPTWIYETSREGGVANENKLMVGAEESTQAWAERNGCEGDPTSEEMPDTEDDGTRSQRLRWQDCDRATELIRIDGGGHTWPQGYQYFREERIGRVAQDFDADDEILEFFGEHAR